MCLYPKFFINKKYKVTKKNGGEVPPLLDQRVKYVPIGCGHCMECLKKKSRDWKIRLNEEFKVNKYCYFVTLTFSNESLKALTNELNILESNAVAGKAVRRFLERWRRRNGKSVKHWFITELGHENTERIHLHGIIFDKQPRTKEFIEELWKYGSVYVGDYCNFRTINYIVKYVTKIDTDHKGFYPQIFCSAGLGKGYTERYIIQEQKNDFYRLPNGAKVALPIYYRNKLFTEQEREEKWLELLDKAERYVNGVKIERINTPEGLERYGRVLNKAQESNKFLGYGDFSKEWQRKDYNITLRMLQKAKQ